MLISSVLQVDRSGEFDVSVLSIRSLPENIPYRECVAQSAFHNHEFGCVFPLVKIRWLVQCIQWSDYRPLELLFAVEDPLAQPHNKGYLSLILELVLIDRLSMKPLNPLARALFLFLCVGYHARWGLRIGIRNFIELSD
jgi:hypothetical protein